MEKKTILMLPSWYPTKESPFSGSFFREQALVLCPYYNFIVLRTREINDIWFFYFLKSLFGLIRPKFNFVQDDNGLKEFSLVIHKPAFLFLSELVYNLRKFLKKPIRQGVGKIELRAIKQARKNAVKYIQKKNLLPSFDCVYSLTAQDMAVLGSAFSTVYKVPHITAEHAPFPWPGSTLKDTTVDSIEAADAFLAISSDKVRQVMLQNIRIKPHYVWNLCDESKFSIGIEKHSVKTFLIVAANNFYKNLPLFIKAMEELKKIATKDFKIILAGYNANKASTSEPKELEKAVFNSSVRDNFTLIERVSREDIPQLYNQCDAFVMTSVQEGLPVSALEASMSGLPVFATRCGGVEDYVDDTMGRIVSVTDYRKLAIVCNDFLNGSIVFDPDHIRERAISLFGKDAFVGNMRSAIDSVMVGRGN